MTGFRSHGKARILIIDDDQTMRLLASVALMQAGFEVEQADGGRAGLARVAQAMPDLILLDVTMPDIDGFAVCRMLRANPESQHLPVLMMTALDDPGSLDIAFEAGATEFVTKPIRWPILCHRVRYMLRAASSFVALRSSQRRLANAQRITQIGDWEWDLEQGRLDASEQLCKIFGGDASVWENSFDGVMGCVHEDDREALGEALEQAISVGRSFAIDHRVVLPDGSQRNVHHQAQVSRIDADQRVLRLSGIVQDITDRKQAENRIRQLAYFDTLTGLPNRLHFTDLLRDALANAYRRKTQVGLMFLDLDNFKRINDTLGHAQGDELLKAVARRLSDCVRVSDNGGRRDPDFMPDAVARLGGDEFTIVLTGLKQALHCTVVARRILDSFRQPIVIGGQEIFASPSIGIALYPNDGAEIDTLLMNADAAMYRAKELGRNNFQFYDGSMNADARTRLALEANLRRAIQRNELFLQYQPKVDIASGRICGAEALLRWHHPERGMISPMEFIPIAEESNLIVPIGDWVLEAACGQIAAWQAAGQPLVPVSINLAAPHVRQIELPGQIAETLRRHRIPGWMLELEVTESMLMTDFDATQRVLQQCGELGVKVAIDDFGTGYSSLAYLKRLPIDSLKIDRAFVRDIASDPDDAAIVSAVVAMAHSLKLRVVAEGVETREQLSFLSKRGCDQFQGFLFSKAIDPDKFIAMLLAQPASKTVQDSASRLREPPKLMVV